MTDYLPFVVIGLTAGSVYALAAMGLVLTYTTSGVFNFAHGAVGMIVAYVFVSLREDTPMPTALAAVVCVAVFAPIVGLALDRLLFRRLARTASTNAVVASIGLLVALQGLVVRIYGPAARRVPPLFPRSTLVTIGDVRVGVDQVIVVAIAAVLATGIVAVFRFSRLGLETRAVVDNRELAAVAGIDGGRVSSLTWMLGCAFAGLSGILMAPLIGLDAVLLTLLVLQAVGAAVVAGLRSVPLAYAGALGIGVAAALCTKWVATRPTLVGLPNSLPFLVLFGVLVLGRRNRFVEVADETQAPSDGRAIEARMPIRGIVALAVAASALPFLVDDSALLTATATVVFVLVFDSLGLLVGQGRLVSLCHATFVVFGATTFAHLLSAGLPYPLALVVAGLSMAPLGAALAVPALRLPSLFLAIATFGFGVLAQYLLYTTRLTFGTDAVAVLGRPAGFSDATPFFLVVLGVVVAAVLCIEWVRAGRMGLLLRALADSPTAVRSIGISPVASRVVVFAIAAFFAGLAGGLLGSVTQVVTPSTFTFQDSLVWLTVLVVAGSRSFGGAVVAALLLNQVSSTVTETSLLELLPIAFGLSAIVFSQAPGGIVGLLDRFGRSPSMRRHQRPEHSRHATRLLLAGAGGRGAA